MPIQPSEYIIGTIIFCFLSISLVGIMFEANKGSTEFTDQQQFKVFNDSFNKYNEVIGSVNNLKTSITETEVDNSIFGTINGVLNSLMNSVSSVFKFLFSSFSFMDDAYQGLLTVLGVSDSLWWLPIIIGLLVIVIFAFGIFSAITRTQL